MAQKTSIAVMSSGSGEPAMNLIAGDFSRTTGHAVRVTFDDKAVPGDGQVFDVIISSRDALERDFRPTHRVLDGEVSIGRIGIGVTTRADAPRPSIASMDQLKQSLLDADTVLLTTHTSGLYIEGLLRDLDILDDVAPNLVKLRNGPLLMDRLLAGSGREFAILSINQIRRYEQRGLILVGPVPDQAQYYREFVAVPMSDSPNIDVAWEFVRYCAGPGRIALAANGFS